MSTQPYQPTHVVPAPGMRAWTSPDSAIAPVDTLGGGLDVQVVQRWGGWAQVQCSNGWTCWVDGNVLQPVGGPVPGGGYAAPAPATSVAPGTIGSRVASPFAILAGAVVLLSSFLPWLSIGGDDTNAFDVPVSFLWSKDAGAADNAVNSIGGLLVVLGIVIAALSLSRAANARRIVGGVTVALALLYARQIQSLLSDIPDAPGLFSTIGFGVYISIVGAALAIADFGRR